MKAAGKKTDITGAKESQKEDTSGLAAAFNKLDIELKAQSNGTAADAMEE